MPKHELEIVVRHDAGDTSCWPSARCTGRARARPDASASARDVDDEEGETP